MSDAKLSFTAADSMPAKLMQDNLLINQIKKTGKISPVHIQFIPTNRCNLKCNFCSCAKDDRKTEMPYIDASKLIRDFAMLGTRAATITGGGEPLMHPYIGEILQDFHHYGIKTGLVTNGLLLKKVQPEILSTLTWCRISHGDFREFSIDYERALASVIENTHGVDWAFSYVVGKNPDIEKIKTIIDFANSMDFSHIRIVADLFQPSNVDMDAIRKKLANKMHLSKVPVILQPRKEPTKGGPCYIAYLKPLIGANQMVYACCGVQYALKEPSKNLPKQLCLGNANNMLEIINKSKKAFDGTQCEKCYYSSYNNALAAIKAKLNHEDFV